MNIWIYNRHKNNIFKWKRFFPVNTVKVLESGIIEHDSQPSFKLILGYTTETGNQTWSSSLWLVSLVSMLYFNQSSAWECRLESSISFIYLDIDMVSIMYDKKMQNTNLKNWIKAVKLVNCHLKVSTKKKSTQCDQCPWILVCDWGFISNWNVYWIRNNGVWEIIDEKMVLHLMLHFLFIKILNYDCRSS